MDSGRAVYWDLRTRCKEIYRCKGFLASFFFNEESNKNIRRGNIEKVLTSREKVESHRAVTVSYQAPLSHRKTFRLWAKSCYLLPLQSFISYCKRVLTSREKVETHSTANSFYKAFLADDKTFLFQQKKFSSYRFLNISGTKIREFWPPGRK